MVREEESKKAAWHQATVSWGQLIVAMLLGFVTVIGSVFIDRLAVDRRLTVVEERQQFVLKSISEMQAQTASFRAEIGVKLDNLQRGINDVIITLTRHEASQIRASQNNNGKKAND
jgi:hypothetical protein